MNIDDLKEISYSMSTMLNISGSSDKRKEASSWNLPHYREFLRLVSDTNIQFHTTWDSVLSAKLNNNETGYELDDILYAAQNRLISPTVTNERLMSLVTEEGFPELPLQAIIDKTLRCGITAESILKACGKVKLFAPSLAKDWLKMSEKLKKKLLATGNYVSTPKMDGLRCLIRLNMPNEGAYSRAMKPLKNLTTHVMALKNMIKFPCIIDGEILAVSNTWADSISAVKKEGSKIEKILYIFDLIPAEEVESGNFILTSEERYALVEDNVDFDFRNSSMFAEVVRTPVATCEGAEAEMNLCISEGWEGSVIHDIKAPYAIKRSNNWVKLKCWLSSEFEVTSLLLGNGKHSKRLGTIMVKGVYEETEITCEVGTGFTDVERQNMWDNQELYVGRTAEIKFHEVSERDSLKFPSFLRWRDDL